MNVSCSFKKTIASSIPGKGCIKRVAAVINILQEKVRRGSDEGRLRSAVGNAVLLTISPVDLFSIPLLVSHISL
jgi:hypothetical protein